MPAKPKLDTDWSALKKFRLVVVAYSSVSRENFATKSAYEAEVEVEERAIDVAEEIRELQILSGLFRGINISTQIFLSINLTWSLIWWIL